jgi:hypothetical protein
VRILLRADSGFAREALMAWCETHRVDYVFGLVSTPLEFSREVPGEKSLVFECR